MNSNINCEKNQLPNASLHEADDNDACLSALHLSFGPLVFTAVLNAAIELNLFEIISKATPPGVSASHVASQLPTHQHHELPRRLDRMLSLLASHSLLTCSVQINEDGGTERLYQLSLAGKYFANDENKGSVGSHATLLSQRAIIDAFLNYKEVLQDCDTAVFRKVHGTPIYEAIQSDLALNNVFNTAMANMCTLEMNKILEVYCGFEDTSFLVDVGGGFGRNLNMIISKYPSIKGINFDLPSVIQNAPHYPGIEHVGGDMFENVPKGDAVILKAVLHNWSDENCLEVLRNCYKALPQNGKVIVVELILPEVIQCTERDKLVTSYDNLMFLGGGSERTKKEFENLCKSSGFSSFEVVCCAFSALGVMEFHK